MTGLQLFHDAFRPAARARSCTPSARTITGAPTGRERGSISRSSRADELEELILHEGPETVAAFIGEPVLGTGGIMPPPEGYWAEIQAVLKKYDVLLIADEVVTGFGRIGTMFGSHHYGIEPDLITIAKGLTSAYAPLSGVIVGERLWNVLDRGLRRASARSAMAGPIRPIRSAPPPPSPISISSMRRTWPAMRARPAPISRERLHEAFAASDRRRGARRRHAGGDRIRGRQGRTRPSIRASEGRAAGLGGSACTQRLIARAMPHGDILGFAPPLCLTREEADIVVSKTMDAVEAVAADLPAKG